jgi:valyl-tRNA synthetase
MLEKILETETKGGKGMKKRRAKTVEESVQDIQNIINKFRNIKRKIQVKSIQKLPLTELDVNNPLHVAEINRRYEIAAIKKAKEKREAREKTETKQKLDSLKHYDYYESWDLEDVKKKSLAQRIKSKLKGGVK